MFRAWGVFAKPKHTPPKQRMSKMQSQRHIKKRNWILNLLEIPANNRNVEIKTHDKTYNVDAKIGNIIVEFNGDFWHGNPEVFPSEKINKINKKSFGELYQKTIRKEQELKNLGYVVISVWEDDFRKNKEQTILAVKNAIQAISNAYAPK